MTLLRDAVAPMDLSTALATRQDLLDVTHDLMREFEGRVPAGSVLRCVVRCRDELVQASVRDGLAAAVRGMAGSRLRLRTGEVPTSRFATPSG